MRWDLRRARLWLRAAIDPITLPLAYGDHDIPAPSDNNTSRFARPAGREVGMGEDSVWEMEGEKMDRFGGGTGG